MRKAIIAAICLLLWLLSAGPATADGQAFLEVEGLLTVDPARDGVAVLQIDRIYRFEKGRAIEALASLEVTCPTDALPAEMAVFGPGDSLTLDWKIVHQPRRSGFKKAKPGRANLSVPEEGWAIRCGSGSSHRIHGLIVADDGLASEIVLEGDPGSILWIKKSKLPGSPERVRLRLAWTPLTPGPAAGSTNVASVEPAGS